MNTLKKFNELKLVFKLTILAVLLVVVAVIVFIIWYDSALVLNSSDTSTREITIELGATTDSIAKTLYENKIISNPFAFKLYVKANHESGFMAGKYILSPSMHVKDIITTLKSGILENSDQITITFLEGKNMRAYAKLIAEKTVNTEDSVFALLSDSAYLNELISKYWFLDKEILNKDIYYSLEGYLFPDTYIFENKEIDVKDIFEKLLERTSAVLEEYKKDITNSTHTVHEILTMASLIEMEGVEKDDKAVISSVFYNRLENNMSLGSDVTTYYAFKIDMGQRDLYANELNTYNPYNTRGPNMAGKLPVGPISSCSKVSILAAINPKTTTYLYFVADKNGKVYFTNTYAEHVNKTNELKQSGLWFEF